jgi:hypothetical protein
MKFARPRFAALAAFGAAAAIAAASLLGGAGAAAQASTTHASTVPVIVSCSGQDVVKPSALVMACADGNWGYQHMHWQVWGSTAYGSATTYMNDCYPDCAQGKFYYFPTLVVVWRPEALPKHAGEQYFSRVSWIYETKACMPSLPKGKVTCLPQTGTFSLLS